MNHGIGALAIALAAVVTVSSGCALFGEQRAQGNPGDMLLVTTARSSGIEVSLSRIALARSSNPEVRRFAERTLADHLQMIQDTRHLATRRGIPILPVPDEVGQNVAAHLLLLSGEELDREYVSEIIAEHAKMAAKFEPEALQQKDPEVRRWASRQLPMVQAHLDMARSIHQTFLAKR